MTKVHHGLFLFYLLLIQVISLNGKDLDYIKNLGQWDAKINYKVNLQGGTLFLEDKTFTYLFYDTKALHDLHELEHDQGENFNSIDHIVEAYSFKVEFIDANLFALKNENNIKTEYNNYFIGNDRSKWKGNVPLFEEVSYNSIYEGIDLNLYSEELNLKYDFIVSPGANPAQIKLQYNHTKNAVLIDGELHINIGFNTIIEQKPYAFQNINGQKVEIECFYVFEGNQLSFEFPNSFDSNYELIIDPVLIAATLSGSTSTNYGHSATFDQEGNIYTGARSFDIGYPTTTGSFQINYGGGNTDIAISKLNPDGSNLIWASYLGGGNEEYPHSMFVQSGELYVLGSTNSFDYPFTENAFDTLNNSTDIIISHLSNDGSSLLGSTFVGGSSSDGVNQIPNNYGDSYRGEIIVDDFGNPYISSFSSSIDFPVSSSAYQTNYNGLQDGVVFKMNSNLSSMLWATYIGGSGDDAAYGLRLDNANNVFVTGGTNSNDFPSTSEAAIPNYIGGDYDAFIAKIKNDGTDLLAATFFGSDGKDLSFFIDIDVSGDVYIFGQNSEVINISPSCYGNTNSAQFIAKFESDLDTVLWQTTIGTGSIGSSNWSIYDLVPDAFMVDDCKHIYISGYYAEDGLFVSNNPIQAFGGFYEMVLEADATAINYATYYTGDHVDGGTSRFDPSGKIYQAVCSGGGFATTSNAYAPNQQSGWDIGVFKINLNTSIVSAQATANPTTSGCAPITVNFSNGSTQGSYLWDFDDGTNSSLENPSHSFVNPGTYNVQLIVTDPESCNFADSLTIPIYVSSSTGEYSFEIDNACLGTPIQFNAIGATNLDTITWNLGDGTIASNQSFIHNYTNTGVYNINLNINSICNFSVSFTDQIMVDVEPSLELGDDFYICQNQTSVITATSDANNYLWQDNSTNNFITVTSGGLYSVQSSNGDCTVSESILVTESSASGEYSFEFDNACLGTPVQFNAIGLTNLDTVLWNLGDGTTTPLFNPLHNYTSNGSYLIDLSIISHCNMSTNVMDLIVVDEEPNLELGDNFFICANDSTLITPISDAENYLWQDNSTNNFLYINTEGIYSLVASKGDCSVSDQVEATLDPFNFNLGNDTILCADEPLIVLDAGSEAISYLWSTGDSAQSITVSNGPYFVNVVSEINCHYTDSINIKVQEFEMNITSSSQNECVPATIEFSDHSSVNIGTITNWEWNFDVDHSTLPSISVYYDTANYYDVELTLITEEGCTETIYLENYIQINPNPHARFIYSFIIENGCEVSLEFTNQSNGETYYHWSFNNGEESFEANPKSTFEYNKSYELSLEVESEFGCLDNTTQEVKIPKLHPIFIPNVFTPNNDSKNETFHPVSECVEDVTFTIFDRWGRLLFLSEQIDIGWDGTFEGELQGNDSYNWQFTYTMDGEIHKEAGFVILLN